MLGAGSSNLEINRQEGLARMRLTVFPSYLARSHRRAILQIHQHMLS
jgi:hypothetical protein